MYGDVKEWCDQCYACKRRKFAVPRHHAPMRTLQAERPFQRIAADILELQVTSKGKRYVLIVEDYFTNFLHLYAMADQKATTVAEYLFQKYILERDGRRCTRIWDGSSNPMSLGICARGRV